MNSFVKAYLKEILDKNGVEEVVVVSAMSHMCIDAAVGLRATSATRPQWLDACATRDLEFGGVAVPAASVHAAMMSALGFA